MIELKVEEVRTCFHIIKKILLSVKFKVLPSYTIKDESNYTQSDLIYLKIKELMEQHKYLEAQTLLLEHLDSDDLQYLKLILYFYDQLDQMNDEQLAKYYLERQIITNNFIDATSKYNCLI